MPKKSRLEKHIEERKNEAASDEFEFTTVPPPEKSPDLFSSTSEPEDQYIPLADQFMSPPPVRCSPPPVLPRHSIPLESSPTPHINPFPQQSITPQSVRCSVPPRYGIPLESSPTPHINPFPQQSITPQSARCSAPPVPPRGCL